jgi:hypothetical protein
MTEYGRNGGILTHDPYDPRTQRIITRTWTRIVTGQ